MFVYYTIIARKPAMNPMFLQVQGVLNCMKLKGDSFEILELVQCAFMVSLIRDNNFSVDIHNHFKMDTMVS